MTEEDVRGLFGKYDSITGVRLDRDEGGKCVGQGVVTFRLHHKPKVLWRKAFVDRMDGWTIEMGLK